MSIPVLVVTGFLGAGKTTLINTLLAQAQNRRISAIVNDFGAINIDADLIAGSADSVVGLQNGCICCTLQGDLLRTLKLVLSRPVRPDHILIEASGVADPRGITEALMDPILRDAVRLDAVVAVVDADEVASNPQRRQDDLWHAQVAAADFIALAKTAGLAPGEISDLRANLGAQNKAMIFDTGEETMPIDALFVTNRPLFAPAGSHGDGMPFDASRFAAVEWQSEEAIHAGRFQAVIQALSPMLIRAKGIVNFVEKPGNSFLLQMVGRRASLTRLSQSQPGCRLVLIGEAAIFDPAAVRGRLADMSKPPF